VHVTVVEPNGNVAPDGIEQLGVIAPSTRSAAAAVYVTAVPPGAVASTVIVPGTVTAGAVVSLTTTLNAALPTLPFESTAVQSIGVEPTGNDPPGAGEHDCPTTAPTGSVASNV
jgi:hypothetical protein